jgi:prepilin-type N-terminal cleavage/methylation domain-containing protein
MGPRIRSVAMRAGSRLAGEEGMTLMELMIVMLLFGILTTIALPSYLSFKDRANQTAAKANIVTAIKSVTSYGNDNYPGSRDDPDLPAANDVGFSNISLTALAARYDASISTVPGAPYVIDPAGWNGGLTSPTDFCLTASVGRWTAVQHGPDGTIGIGTTFIAASCSVSGS